MVHMGWLTRLLCCAGVVLAACADLEHPPLAPLPSDPGVAPGPPDGYFDPPAPAYQCPTASGLSQAVFASPPSIVQNPNATVPLVAIASVQTSTPLRGCIRATSANHSFTAGIDLSTSTHSLPVIGMRAATAYSIEVGVTDGTSTVYHPTALNYTTPALPAGFPAFQLTVSGEGVEPGVKMLPAGGALLALDQDGYVVWYYRHPSHPVTVFDFRSNGHLTFVSQNWKIVEIDMLGNQYNLYYAANNPAAQTPPVDGIPVDTNIFHHEMYEMPNGNLVTLDQDYLEVSNYPMDPVMLAPMGETRLKGDRVVEFDAAGQLVVAHSLFDIIDPGRLVYDSLQGNDATGRDWSHSNAVIYTPWDDSFVVSIRHQDAVIKLGRETGELKWILGAPERWQAAFADKLFTKVGDFDWQFHQHAPMYTPNGLLLFDNGNHRAIPPEQPDTFAESYSRVLEFRLDEAALTAEVTFSFGELSQDRFYSGALGNADWLPHTGNMLVTDGFRQESNYQWGRVFEVSREGEIVWEIKRQIAGVNTMIYRAVHVHSLYR